jgi:predicted transcriptional regulator
VASYKTAPRLTDAVSKITFRANDDLVARLEEFDASKSEVMRDALRAYLNDAASDGRVADGAPDASGVDDAIADRVDELVAERLDAAPPRRRERDVNVNITLDGVNPTKRGVVADEESTRRDPVDAGRPNTTAEDAVDARKTRGGTASSTSDEAASEPQTERKPCGQCGENVAGDHVYCPNCGEKTSHRVFCECGDELRSDWGFCPSCGRRTPAADVLDRS